MEIEKKWTPKTKEDFPHLNCLIDRLNKPMEENFDGEVFTSDSPWDLSLRVESDEENGITTLEILDSNEELYYDGFRFEKTMEELEDALRKDTEDSEAYFDCICPGRWSADFEGRYRYDMESLKGHIECEVNKAILNYMISNDKQPNWGIHKEKAELLDECIEDVCKVIKTLF